MTWVYLCVVENKIICTKTFCTDYLFCGEKNVFARIVERSLLQGGGDRQS